MPRQGQGSGGFSNPHDIFSQLFGGQGGFQGFQSQQRQSQGFGGDHDIFGGPRKASNGKRKDPPLNIDLPCSLEELFTGKQKKMKITRKRLAPNGCLGTESKILVIDVKPGWKAGTRVTFPGEGDQHIDPSITPSDVTFTVREKKHPRFERQGADLVYTHPLTLKEVLCSSVTNFKVQTLSGAILPVSVSGVQPTSTKRIAGQGMPSKSGPGDLLVKFDVKLPSALTQDQRRRLSGIL
jgi:DnaJ-class molecular chaperone